MIVYPRHQLRPKYVGETRVFGLLAQMPDDDGFAVHSVNLPDHEYKRWGEADFVVVNRSGVTLIEVKGGSVSFAGRVWRYSNARGQSIKSTEGPARQAISAAVSLEALLGEHLGRKIRCRWGVCFPLSRFTTELAELPAARLAESDVCADSGRFAEWLHNLPFDQHEAADFALDTAEIEAIRGVIVPTLSATTSVHLAVCSAREKVIRLTAQQATLLDSLSLNARLCVSGGAGTGKTELAALTARVEKEAGRTPAIVTSPGPFRDALAQRMASFGIPVVTSTLPAGTDTLIVDEGQDFARPDEMALVFSQLPGGVEAGRWRWFMDPNLQFSDCPPDAESLRRLAANAVAVTLTRNVRSTTEIVSTIQSLLDADTGISEIDGFGIRVGMHRVSNDLDESNRCAALVKDLLESGIAPSDVAILGPAGGSDAVRAALLQRFPHCFRPLSPAAPTSSGTHGVISDIKRFRGLEAQVVLLTDLRSLSTGIKGAAELYVGMSRASAALHLFIPPAFAEQLRLLIRQSFK
jgi:hypothetical protein